VLPPNATLFHKAVPKEQHPATLPRQALFVPPPCLVFFPTAGKALTKDSPSDPRSKTVADFYEGGATAALQQDYPLSPP
jgi:hypothetical protein